MRHRPGAAAPRAVSSLASRTRPEWAVGRARRRRAGRHRLDVAHGLLVAVRRSKTNQAGEVWFVKAPLARAIRTLRAAGSPAPGERVVPLSAKMIGLRFTAAAEASTGGSPPSVPICSIWPGPLAQPAAPAAAVATKFPEISLGFPDFLGNDLDMCRFT